MRNFFLAILACALVFGLGTTVYAWPQMGDDCASCHGGGSDPDPGVPGCGSSGCNRRISAANLAASNAEPEAGAAATEVTKEDGFTIIHPAEMDFDHQVIVWNKGVEARKRLLEKIASWGVVVVAPGQGQDKSDCAKFMDDLNNDPKSKFFDKLDIDGIIDFPKP